MLGSLGHRVRAAALDFARWAPSAGVLLLLASVLAVALSNSPFAERFESFWERPWGFIFGELTFRMSLRDWIDEGLLTVFFLVVGLEIKREFTTGSLASRRSAALPIAGAVGGMTLPALIYISLLPSGPWTHGWGVPIATDTAFAIALVAAMGRRVPIELRIFLTAAAIVDDIGAIVVVALFYAGAIDWSSLAGAALLVGVLALLNSARVYRVAPYVLTGVALWACVHASGLHSTLAGVLLAVFIPTRPPPDFRTLSMQADAILMTEARRGTEILRRGPSEPAMRALDAIHDRLESPADRMLRLVGPNSTYLVLPLFALANAGVALEADVFSGHGPLMLAIVLGLTIGKPLGITLACLAAARLGIAVKPDAYSWRQLLGAGALAGIGFTMSLFIAAQAFPMRLDFEAAKVAVFSASVLSVLIGVGLLWSASEPEQQTATAMRPARVTPDSASEPSS
jgi:NhaA family Na+:H+ antiporter